MTHPPSNRDKPDVSVIMPCLNGMPFLPGAVEAVLAQDVSVELFYVDGGSTDGSMAWIRELSDPRVIVLSVPPGTPPDVARNRAASQASAALLAFADADDVWRPEKLARQVDKLQSMGATVVYGDCTVIDAEGCALGSFLSRHRPAQGDVFTRLLEENFVPLSTVLVTAAAFARVGGFPEDIRIGGDYLMLIELARIGRFAFDPAPVCSYRIHGDNLTRDFRRAYADNAEIFTRLEARAESEQEREAVTRAAALIYWRWALRELLAGPANWREALRLASEAAGSSGGAGAALVSLVQVGLGGLRGLPLRWRMAAARQRGAR